MREDQNMTIQSWLMAYIGLGCFILVSFIVNYLKDLKVRPQTNQPAKVLLVDWSLLILAISAIGLTMLLYFNWQEQLMFFQNM